MGKKVKKKNSQVQEQYEVELIHDHRDINGKREYKIHWKGYPCEEDQWVFEDGMACEDLVAEYLRSKFPKYPKEKEIEQPTGTGTSSGSTTPNSDECQVEYIHDHRDVKGYREYYIHWQGYECDKDSWIPEEDMKCDLLIAQYLRRIQNTSWGTSGRSDRKKLPSVSASSSSSSLSKKVFMAPSTSKTRPARHSIYDTEDDDEGEESSTVIKSENKSLMMSPPKTAVVRVLEGHRIPVAENELSDMASATPTPPETQFSPESDSKPISKKHRIRADAPPPPALKRPFQLKSNVSTSPSSSVRPIRLASGSLPNSRGSSIAGPEPSSPAISDSSTRSRSIQEIEEKKVMQQKQSTDIGTQTTSDFTIKDEPRSESEETSKPKMTSIGWLRGWHPLLIRRFVLYQNRLYGEVLFDSRKIQMIWTEDIKKYDKKLLAESYSRLIKVPMLSFTSSTPAEGTSQ